MVIFFTIVNVSIHALCKALLFKKSMVIFFTITQPSIYGLSEQMVILITIAILPFCAPFLVLCSPASMRLLSNGNCHYHFFSSNGNCFYHFPPWNTLHQLSIHRAPELLFRGTLFRCFTLFSGCQSVIRNLEQSAIGIWASGATQALFRSSASPLLRLDANPMPRQ